MLSNVVIIGAGPAGLLLAHYLLKRGNYCVNIYERRPDPRAQNLSNNRTFPISLQERGRKAIRAISGLEEAIMAESTFCYGTIIHRKNRQARKIHRKNGILTIDRNRLVAILLQQLTETYKSEQLKITFDCQYTQVDGKVKTVTLLPEGGESFEVHYDLLVGADGARSQVREYLTQEEGLQCEQNYIADAYKSVFLSRINPQQNLELEGNKIHSWNLYNKTRMLLVPLQKDRLNGVIIFDAESNPVDSLSTKEEVLQFFQDNFPTFAQLMSVEEADDFVNRPVARVLTVRCQRFHHGDSILLIGDAAHAVSPSIGQGCNSSLEDVFVLGNLLQEYGDDWGKVLPLFSEQRVPDAHALRELSNYSFPQTKLLVVEFLLRLTLGRFLYKYFPNLVKPFVLDLVLDTDLPYSQVLHLSQGWINKVKRSMNS